MQAIFQMFCYLMVFKEFVLGIAMYELNTDLNTMAQVKSAMKYEKNSLEV